MIKSVLNFFDSFPAAKSSVPLNLQSSEKKLGKKAETDRLKRKRLL